MLFLFVQNIRRNIKLSSKIIKEATYKALVRPILEYGSPVWDTHTTDDTDMLEKVQRRATRWTMNRFRNTSSVGEMLQDLRWPTLEKRRQRARLALFYKFHHGTACINSRFLPLPNTRRRRVRSTHHLYTMTCLLPEQHIDRNPTFPGQSLNGIREVS